MPDFKRVGQSTTSPTSNLQRMTVRVRAYVDDKGYVQNAGFAFKPISALENGPIDGPKAIVLHRTDSYTVDSALRSFQSGIGTHFIVAKDGAVTQAASLLNRTAHVGKIKSRAAESGSPAGEAALIKGWGWAPAKIYNHEKSKSYPDRYPMNQDSVGIETVAKHRGDSGWEAPTAEQSASIATIVRILKDTYGLGEDDIYEHDNISYKTDGEGAGLYSGDPVSSPGMPPTIDSSLPGLEDAANGYPGRRD